MLSVTQVVWWVCNQRLQIGRLISNERFMIVMRTMTIKILILLAFLYSIICWPFCKSVISLFHDLNFLLYIYIYIYIYICLPFGDWQVERLNKWGHKNAFRDAPSSWMERGGEDWQSCPQLYMWGSHSPPYLHMLHC